MYINLFFNKYQYIKFRKILLNMSEKNWINIFLLRDFISYLDRDELIDLSMSQKIIRLKLSAVAFSTFNFNNFIKDQCYKSYLMDKDYDNYDKWARQLENEKYAYMNEESEVDSLEYGTYSNYDEYIELYGEYYEDCYRRDSEEDNDEDNDEDSDKDSVKDNEIDLIKAREEECEHFYLINPYLYCSDRFGPSCKAFELDIVKFQGYPRKLNLDAVKDYYYLLYKIPNIFNNLETLVVNDSRITFEVFEYLLNNLNFLHNLELTDSTLIIYNQNSNNYFINWPLNLKKLIFIDNNIKFSRDTESPILLKPGDQLALNGESLHISPKHLPNLVSFDYKQHTSTDYPNSIDIDEIDDLHKFLELNYHIKKLTMRFDHYSSALFKTIDLFNNLEHLDISKSSSATVRESELTNLPVLNNLKCLNLGLMADPDVFKLISQKLPNLTRLIARFHYEMLPQLCYSIKELKNLKHLNLGLYRQFSNSILFDLPALNNLETLEIRLGEYEEFNSVRWYAKYCPKLRKVKIIRHYGFPLFEKPYLNSMLRGIWKLVYFPTKITYYKI
ncbi:hypothetical protein CONCODRAFT_170489 [Conidiobolus coronatus NRRL 28638]|uniref:RNI-like protein n=1 Tax=Conidiobolus coronatus (strain ATCC 28846 / CBS 209.66 / NRRL 28638) TaxID=796925 RepID=A0A137P6R5_CONC2|nr:hypothetical protein CONCODRAFT_170489 [Conidiobolus coronatus NRRL 28638]|eukprot:KXN70659.1 hypothetical protein CONCODRAFT_170489 [Conidiobolus coronatus NRRL 28638]